MISVVTSDLIALTVSDDLLLAQRRQLGALDKSRLRLDGVPDRTLCCVGGVIRCRGGVLAGDVLDDIRVGRRWLEYELCKVAHVRTTHVGDARVGGLSAGGVHAEAGGQHAKFSTSLNSRELTR